MEEEEGLVGKTVQNLCGDIRCKNDVYYKGRKEG
jgi:hypothetical protein